MSANGNNSVSIAGPPPPPPPQKKKKKSHPGRWSSGNPPDPKVSVALVIDVPAVSDDAGASGAGRGVNNMKYQMQEEHGRRGPAMSKRVVIFLAVGVVLSLIGVALIIAALVLRGASCEHEAPTETSAGPHVDNRCLYSAEAKRVNLDSFLAEVKTTYYQMRPNEIVYDPDTTDSQAIGQRFRPYDARPEAIKKRTDKARALYARAKSIADKAKQAKLKPRELKALAQVQHFLQSNFGAPYDENYYAGDWMLGPNKFCWQPICSVGYDLKTHYPADRSYGFHPESVEDLDTALTQLKATGDSVTEYINNVALGVKAGFIRSVEECQDGLYSIQRRFPNIYREGPRGECFLASLCGRAGS